MKRFILSLPIFITISAISVCNPVGAQAQSPGSMPTREDFRTLEQPNGDTIAVIPRGDAVFHWLETRAGYIVVKNTKTGYYEYAVLHSDQGKLSLLASGVVVEKAHQPSVKDDSVKLAKSSDAAQVRMQKLKQR